MFTYTQTKRKSLLKNQKGMTLIEILIVISLIAVIGGMIGGNLFSALDEGKKDSARIQMKNFAGVLGQYRRHCNSYPTSEQGLDALVSKPSGGRECKRYQPGGYLQDGTLPLDPWDGEYVYESDGRKFTIISAGPDQTLGTEDDISSADK